MTDALHLGLFVAGLLLIVAGILAWMAHEGAHRR